MISMLDPQVILKRNLQTDRRSFLKVAALGSAGFAVGCAEKTEPAAPAGSTATTAAASETSSALDHVLNAFVHVSSDNTVTVVCKHLDMGQGVTTGLPAIVAEELDADWSQMRVEFAPADAAKYKNLIFGMQGTGGSTSIANSFEQMRGAGAAARAMLVDAAAKSWGVSADTIEVRAGVVSDATHSATFGELAQIAANESPPESPVLKDPADFTLIGQNLPRLDSSAKTDGSAAFTLDVQRPGMQVAVVARPARFGAKVASFDASDAQALAGVSQVVEIPRGIAVIADSYHTANKARGMLKIEWDEAAAEKRSSDELQQALDEALANDGVTATDTGDFASAWSDAAQTVEAQFDFPFLAHASMEPLDCVIELSDEGCDIWTGSQMQTMDQAAAARILGLAPTQVRIHTQFAGGSFGRRAVPDSDFVSEAAMIAKATGGQTPIKLQWSREDDMRGGRYRPMTSHRVRAAIDADGNISGWEERVATQSIMKGTAFEAFAMKDGLDPATVEGASNLAYAVPSLHVSQHLIDSGVPVLWWRSVGHTHTAYATEVFFDMVAKRAGKDPFEWRRELLKDRPRHLAVLELAAEKAGWGTPLAAGKARGIAVHESFSSFVAEVAEVSVAENGEFSVDRVTCAVDCGIAVTPDVIRAQIEGGIGYGLSAAMREAVTLTEGVVDQDNFHRYQPLRMDEMPIVDVHIVPSAESPTGVGEPGTPPIGPAVANALAAATGTFVTRLPIADQLRKT